MSSLHTNLTLGIDIGSTTVKVAFLDADHKILFSDYERHFADIQKTLAGLLQKNADVAYWDLLISFTVAYAAIAIIIAVSNRRGRKAQELLK